VWVCGTWLSHECDRRNERIDIQTDGRVVFKNSEERTRYRRTENEVEFYCVVASLIFVNKAFKYSMVENIQHGGSLFLVERLVLERVFLVTTNSCMGTFAAKWDCILPRCQWHVYSDTNGSWLVSCSVAMGKVRYSAWPWPSLVTVFLVNVINLLRIILN